MIGDGISPDGLEKERRASGFEEDAMVPSRYMVIDEKCPYPVKRRVRGGGSNRGSESAIVLLPPDPYLIMEKPDQNLSPSPTVYRTTAPKSAKNKEASSFVILGETIATPVQSRPGSPSGRISPFRGHGFKTPTTTRPNSTAPSPSQSPRKNLHASKPSKPADRPRNPRDIGLPPKSPMKSKARPPRVEPTSEAAEGEDGKPGTEASVEAGEGGAGVSEKPVGREKAESATSDGTSEAGHASESFRGKKVEAAEGQPPRNLPPPQRPKPRQTLVTPRERKPPTSPAPHSKVKTERNQSGSEQSVIKKTTKPPIPAKKVGLKTSLKAEEDGSGEEKKSKKAVSKGKEEGNESGEKKEEDAGTGAVAKKEERENEKVEEEEEKEEGKEGGSVREVGAVAGGRADVEKAAESRGVGAPGENKSQERNEKKTERMVPCFQPDKCQIAPPTMASPSPIVTPTMSTPSTTSDLASSSIKNSQSIAAAPTTVTPSSLSSVSSTLVLTGNLARKEIQTRSKPNEPDEGAPPAYQVPSSRETQPPAPLHDPQDKTNMVKPATQDSVDRTKKDALSGEITSTKVIRAEPDVEVLSPNNLRDSPPRMPPPNLAWDEERVPNGDVPNKAESEGKFRRAMSLVWRLLNYLLCCRCWRASKCCRSSSEEGVGKDSLLSRLNCCKQCRSPFKCCEGRNCCRCCEGKTAVRCCRRKANGGGDPEPKRRKCCAKANCNCKGCCGDKLKNLCLCSRDKLNSICRSLFCLNMFCCQKFLRKFKRCHKLKCCQKSGFCSCCNPNLKKEPKKLNKKGSRTSNNSRQDRDNLDMVLVEHTSLMKAAIPVLPSCLAVFCLILNLFVPGFGTFVSGVLCLCFGKARFSVKDTPKNRLGSFVLNTIIGVAQLFTVVFCLVGWGWSIWWGVIMYKLSPKVTWRVNGWQAQVSPRALPTGKRRADCAEHYFLCLYEDLGRQKRLKLAEKNQKEAEGSNVNHNHVDVEQG